MVNHTTTIVFERTAFLAKLLNAVSTLFLGSAFYYFVRYMIVMEKDAIHLNLPSQS